MTMWLHMTCDEVSEGFKEEGSGGVRFTGEDGRRQLPVPQW